MEDKTKYRVMTRKTKWATIIMYRPQVTEEEKKQILQRIAKIKATW